MVSSTKSPTKPLKILVLADEVPYPPNSGKRIRTWNLLRRLAKRHSISFLCYGRGGEQGTERLETSGIRVHLVEPRAERHGWWLYASLIRNLFSRFPYSVCKLYSKRFATKLLDLLNEESFDLIHCEGTLCARYFDRLSGIPRVAGTHNIESQIWERRTRYSRTLLERIFFTIQTKKMRRFERRTLSAIEAATAVTLHDVQQLRDWKVPKVSLVPNGVDLAAYQPSLTSGEDSELLFLASLDWFPNADSLRYFLDEIFPLILQLRNSVFLRIVGRRPMAGLKSLVAGRPHIELVGEVDDITPHLARAGVVVVPLRIGGGSRLKILEALAMAKAVVSTAVGAEGLNLIPGEDYCLAESPTDFARRVTELMESPDKRGRLGRHGWEVVSKQYGWDEIVDRLEASWLDAVRRSDD